MKRLFRILIGVTLALHLIYITGTILAFDSLPRAIESYEVSEFTEDYERSLFIFGSAIIESIFVLLGLAGIFFFKTAGRWLLGFGLTAALAEFFAQPAMTDHGWNAAISALSFLGIGVIGGLTLHPEVRSAFSAKQKRAGGIVLGAMGVLGIISVGIGVFVMGKMLRVLPQEPNPNLPKSLNLSRESTGPEIEAELKRYTKIFLREKANAGIAIGVTQSGKQTIVTDGNLTREANSPKIDKDTLFEIGSVSKSFTGYLLAQQVKLGTVKLDDPVTSHVDISLSPIDDEPVTLYDLATHHGGLPKMPGNLGFGQELKRTPFAGLTTADLFATVEKASRQPDRRRRYQFSNVGYSLLLKALPTASHQALFDQFGLTNTYFSSVPETQLHRLATGHNRGLEIATWHDGGAAIDGAGSIVSSPGDLLKWTEAWLAAEPDSAMALAIETRRHRSRLHGDIGIGWNIKQNPGRLMRVYHNGATGGFRSFVGFVPEAELGVVFLINSTDPAADTFGLELINSLLSKRED